MKAANTDLQVENPQSSQPPGTPGRLKLVQTGLYSTETKTISREELETSSNNSAHKFVLHWETPPQTVLIVKKPNDPEVLVWFQVICRHLLLDKKLRVVVEPSVSEMFPQFHTFYPGDYGTLATEVDFVVTVGGDGTFLHVNSLFPGVVPPVLSFAMGSLGFLTPFNVREHREVFDCLLAGDVHMTLRSRLVVGLDDGQGRRPAVFQSKQKLAKTARSISTLYVPNPTPKGPEGSVPAVTMASGGFVPPRTPLVSPPAKKRGIAPGPPPPPPPPGSLSPTLFATGAVLEDEEGPNSPPTSPVSVACQRGTRPTPIVVCDGDARDTNDAITPKVHKSRPETHDASGRSMVWKKHDVSVLFQKPFTVVNEVVVDRGPNPYITDLELLVNGRVVTRLQGDGLIISTPTGRTAYSMSAGGSLLHPLVPAIIATPISPHSISARPVIIPDSAEVAVRVPKNSRSTAWVSLDGKFRGEIPRGHAVVLRLSPRPLPCITRDEGLNEWFQDISNILRWNDRASQKPWQAEPSTTASF